MQPAVVMAFRKRLKSYGYSNISIKKNEKTDDYKVTAVEPLSGATVSSDYTRIRMSHSFR